MPKHQQKIPPWKDWLRKTDDTEHFLDKWYRYRIPILWGLLGVCITIAVMITPYIPTDTFLKHTTINDIDVSGLTLDETLETLELKSVIEITEHDILLVAAPLREVGHKLDDATKNAVEALLPKTITLWQWLKGGTAHTINYKPHIDFSQLIQFLTQYGITNQHRTKSQNAELQYDNGYYIQPKKQGDWLDFTKLEKIINQLSGDRFKIELTTLYTPPTVTRNDEKLTHIIQKLERLATNPIQLQLNQERVTIPENLIRSWLILNESGDITIDATLVTQYLNELNQTHATLYKTRTFQSTLQGEVYIQAGTLGWTINTDQTIPLIESAILAGVPTVQPVIIDGFEPETLTLYVEVDLLAQHLWVYQQGSIILETPIVSGRVGTDTVPGAYYVWDKNSPANLSGYNPYTGSYYEQPVDYWMPFDYTGQGIHDANWQPVFGGDAYIEGGSLGCINVPPTVMPFLYEIIEIGTPVIIY